MADQSTVTLTRILVPRKRPQLLSRRRLLDFLHANLDRRLFLLVAPAGYGKTSLLTDYASDTDLPICWYSLSESDQDLSAFAQYLTVSLQQTFPHFSLPNPEILQNLARAQEIESLVGVLVNAIQTLIPEFFVLIFDDYHTVNDSRLINHFLDTFLSRLPENCHIILSSRTIPTLTPGGLALLTARQQVAGTGIQELRFTAAEIQTLLKESYGEQISDSAAQELAQRSEGWITGILLTQHNLWQGLLKELSQISGTGSQVFDYLTNQVFVHQEPEIQEFLLQSSVLGEMSAPVCDAVLARQDSERVLNLLDERNLFIARLEQGQERWWRYHQLFRDFLGERLTREFPNRIAPLHLRAAEWRRAREEWTSAITHYLKAGVLAQAAQVIESIARQYFNAGHLGLLANWIDALPLEELDRHPQLLRVRGLICSEMGETEQALGFYDRAERCFEELGDPIGLANTWVNRSVVMRFQGHLNKCMQDCSKALDLLEAAPPQESVVTIRAEAYRNIGICCSTRGQLMRGTASLEKALQLFESTRQKYNIAMLASDLANSYRMQGDLTTAQRHLERALRLWEEIGTPGPTALALANLGLVHSLRGEHDAALEFYQRALAKAEEGTAHRIRALAYQRLGDLYIETEKFEQAREMLEEAQRIVERVHEHSSLHWIWNSIGTALLLQGQSDQAAKYIRQALRASVQQGMSYDHAYYLICLAAALSGGGKSKAALELLELAHVPLKARRASRELCLLHLLRADIYNRQKKTKKVNVSLEEMAGALKTWGSPVFLIPWIRPMLPFLRQAAKKNVGGSTLADLVARTQPEHAPAARASVSPRVEEPISFFGFGRPRVQRGERILSPAEWGMLKARDLAFYLLCRQGATKDEIGVTFWPDLSPARVRGAFHVTTYRVRHALGRQDCILYENERYAFNRALPHWFDVESFESLLRQADALARPEADRAYDLRRQAVALYAGDFMEDAASDQWASHFREALLLRYLRAMRSIGEHQEARDHLEDALTTYHTLLAKDSFAEEGHRAVMRCHARLGNRTAALKHYQNLVAIMNEEFGAEPLPETRALYQQILNGAVSPAALDQF